MTLSAEVAEWLAERPGSMERDQPSTRGGDRRRTFVADELIEAGFPGTALSDGVMRLTGLDEEQAQAAIAARPGPTRDARGIGLDAHCSSTRSRGAAISARWRQAARRRRDLPGRDGRARRQDGRSWRGSASFTGRRRVPRAASARRSSMGDGRRGSGAWRAEGAPARYSIRVSNLNIGRYIAMTIVPTMMPTPIIRIGSMIEVSDWMLASTSSS